MSLTLVPVRHGRTEDNTENPLKGWRDPPLTTGGRSAVRVIVERLSNGRHSAAAYAAPSGRMLDTAAETRSPSTRGALDQ